MVRSRENRVRYASPVRWLLRGLLALVVVYLALFTAVAVGVLIVLYVNLTVAARTARPDVLWELEDQLGLPGRVVIEPLIRRFLPLVLALIAVLPIYLSRGTGVLTFYLAGTSLLIVVGVALETMKQIEAYVLMRHYEGFMR